MKTIELYRLMSVKQQQELQETLQKQYDVAAINGRNKEADKLLVELETLEQLFIQNMKGN